MLFRKAAYLAVFTVVVVAAWEQSVHTAHAGTGPRNKKLEIQNDLAQTVLLRVWVNGSLLIYRPGFRGLYRPEPMLRSGDVVKVSMTWSGKHRRVTFTVQKKPERVRLMINHNLRKVVLVHS